MVRASVVCFAAKDLAFILFVSSSLFCKLKWKILIATL